MPKLTTEELVPLSIRVEPETDQWLRDHVEARSESTNRVIRDVLNDHRTLFGLSAAIIAALAEDARAHSIRIEFRSSDGRPVADWRPYVIDVLNQRALAVSAGRPPRPPDSPRPKR